MKTYSLMSMSALLSLSAAVPVGTRNTVSITVKQMSFEMVRLPSTHKEAYLSSNYGLPTTSQTPINLTADVAPSPFKSGFRTAYNGDMTWYTPGLGSCGWTNVESDSVVALPVAMMNNPANPNVNPICGKPITISYGGVTAQATIVDTCWGCAWGSIDLSPSLFKQFASLDTGRVHGVEWWYN